MDILLVDDEARVRSALWLLLRQEFGVNIVGEASDLSQALALTAMRKPNVLLLDWDLLGENGSSVLDRLREAAAELSIIALSLRSEARTVALQAGADAFVCKGDAPDRLKDALLAIDPTLRGELDEETDNRLSCNKIRHCSASS
jgi:DNA-binding NarL/FixJ family response regulator